MVFTQYDALVMKEEYQLRESGIPRSEDEIKSLAKSKAYQFFDEACIIPMKKVNSRIPCLCVSGGESYLPDSTSLFPDMQIR